MGNAKDPKDAAADDTSSATMASPSPRQPDSGSLPPAPGENAAARVGTVLRDKWRLDALLGTGGHAAVYAASHMNNGKRAAVKVLHPELSARADLVRRMLREGFFANQISHASAVSVLDDDRADDGSVYLVMDLLEGHSLDRYVGGTERLPPSEVLRVAEQVLGFLIEAHAAGILHRDIKPANLFLTDDGQVKVLDFGIARLAESTGDSSATQTDTKLGTPAYMPPEQARGRWNLLDGRSDIWALGATMYALLNGKKPRDAETANEELLLAMTEALPSLGTGATRFPVSLVGLVDRAVAFEMGDRWPDATAMQKAVRVAKIALDDDDGELTEHQDPSDLPPPRPLAPPPSRGSAVPAPPVRGAAIPAPPVRPAGRVVMAPPAPPARGAALPAPPPPPARPAPRAPTTAPPPSNRGQDLGTGVSAMAGPAYSTLVNLLSLAHAPQMGFILIGAHHPEGEPARLRAYDPRRRAIVWEALEGEDWLEYLKDIRVIGRWVLIPNRSMLHCLDLGTGHLLWSANTTDKVDLIGGGVHRGPAIHEASGVLVAKTIGRMLIALDPATGQEKARRKFDASVDLLAVDGDPQVVVRFDQADRGLMEILAPATLEVAGRFGKAWFGDESSVLAAYFVGTHIVAHVESWGLLSARGVFVGEVATRKEVLFERDRNVDLDVVPSLSAGHLVYVTVNGDIHLAPGNKKAPIPLAGHRVKSVTLAGATLFVALEDTAGVVQLVALDAATLAPKLQYGALAPMGQAARLSKRDPMRYVLAEGGLAYFVARRDGSAHGELRVVDVATGSIVSTRSLSDVGVLDDWYLQAGCVVLWSHTAVRVIDPTRGITIASYTATAT
jgi:eukaryotic-like serine/threonine-protein kinase